MLHHFEKVRWRTEGHGIVKGKSMALPVLTSDFESQTENAMEVATSAHLADSSQEQIHGLLFAIRNAIAVHEETTRRLLILVAL
jgi:hypothetical protein